MTGMDIKLARVKLGMYQNELARRCGIHHTRMSEYECGRREVPVRHMLKILTVLDEESQAQNRKVKVSL